MTKLKRLVLTVLILHISNVIPEPEIKNFTVDDVLFNFRDSIKLPFREYLEKYDPKNVWERVTLMSEGDLTKNDTLDALLEGLDEVDDLLSLKVQKTNPQVVEQDGRRRWYPPGRLVTRVADSFNIRHRIYGLIQTAIYQARNSMTKMQSLRSIYRNNSLYKMGYLMSKTDNACKTFTKFAKMAFRYCSLFRFNWADSRMKLRDLMAIEERQLTLLFQVELLIDLVKLNDDNCREMMLEVHWERKEKWEFVD